jgi:ATP/maltotriose-dependent transcriptional regulator MalT
MSAHEAPAAIVDCVMEPHEFVERLRRLRRLRDQYDASLVEGFRLRAETVRRSDPHEAERSARLGLVVAEAIRDRAGRLACLSERAKAAVMCGETAAALDSIEDASHLAREIGDAPVRAEIELLRAQVLLSQERYVEARDSVEALLPLVDGSAAVGLRLIAHMTLADLEFRMDRPRAALREYRIVDRLLTPAASKKMRALLSMNRANALAARGRFRAADRHFDRARQLFRELSWDHSVAQVDCNAAYAATLRGDYDRALRLQAECERVFRRADDVRHLAHLDLDRAQIHLHVGMADEAATFATSAEVRFLTLGLIKERAQAIYIYARAAAMRGDFHTATAWFERAERLFRDLGLEERVLSCVVSRAEILEKEGDRGAAGVLAAEARRTLRRDMSVTAAARTELLEARLDLAAGDPAAAVAAAETVLARGNRCRRFLTEAGRVLGEARAALAAIPRGDDSKSESFESTAEITGPVGPSGGSP